MFLAINYHHFNAREEHMDTLINSGRTGTDIPPQIDPAPFVKGLFQLLLKGAQRLVNLNEEGKDSLMQLAMLLPKADEKEKGEIFETMVELLFPEDHIGGVSKTASITDRDAAARVEKCREQIGKQIKELRESQHLTQDELAEKAGIPQSHVCRLERGKHTPTHVTIEKIAEALGVKPSDIDVGYPE